MSWLENKALYTEIVQSIEPSCILTTKNHWVWKAIAYAFAIVTFWRVPPKRFLEESATTIGPVMGYPEGWSALSRKLLKHEAQHVKQFRYFGLGIHPWVGFPFMALTYLLLPFPLLFAWCRYRLEINADRASWRFQLERGKSPDSIRKRAEQFARSVCGSMYSWSWPLKPGIKGFKKSAEDTIDEYQQSTQLG